MDFSGKSRKTKEKQREKATPNTDKQILEKFPNPIPERFSTFSESFWNGLGRDEYSENYIFFLNIITMIYKNKYSAFGNIQTMVQLYKNRNLRRLICLN